MRAYNFGGSWPHETLPRFLTIFDFDRKYLRNGLRYRRLEKYFFNYTVSQKNCATFYGI